MDPLLYKSIDRETTNSILSVEGSIPYWLEGSLIRNGPAKFELGESKLDHWFDGFAMLHKFDINQGQVTYKSRFIQSKDYKNNLKAGKIKSRHWGTIPDPCASIFNRFFSTFQKPNPSNTNVSIVKVNDRIAAVSDFSSMIEFDFESLETKEEVSFKDKFKNNYMFSAAHPSFDPASGELFNCLGKPGPKGEFYFYKLEQEFQRQFIGKLTTRKHTYFHSFALTKRYFIFIQQPLEVNIWQLLFMRLLNKTYESCFHWHPENGTVIHLIDRSTGSIKSFKTEPFFFFHTINAFEDNNKIIIDLCLYNSPEIIKELFLDRLKENGLKRDTSSKPSRIIIDLLNDKTTIETLSEEILELPSFNTHHSCVDYKFSYGLGIKSGMKGDVHNQLVKLNVKKGSFICWYSPGHYPSEPLFISKPGAKDEDDGIIVSVVLNTLKKNSYLLILDAKDFTELAKAEAPIHLPIGLHGVFYSSKGH